MKGYVGYFDRIYKEDRISYSRSIRYFGITLYIPGEGTFLIHRNSASRKKINIPKNLKENKVKIDITNSKITTSDDKPYTDLSWEELKGIIETCNFSGELWKPLGSLLEIDELALYQVSCSEAVLYL